MLTLAHFLDKIPIKTLLPYAKGISVAIILTGILVNVTATYRSFTVNRQFWLNVDLIRNDARVVTQIQQYLKLDAITFAGPDMGGLLLFEGDGKRIIDLGMLCNRELAKRGDEIVDEYVLANESPELIEFHDNWVAPFVNSALLYEQYFPVRVVTDREKIVFFMRKDIVVGLEERQAVEEIAFTEETDMRPDLFPILTSYGGYLELDLSN